MRTKTKVIIAIAGILVITALYSYFVVLRPPEYYARQHWNDICEKIDSGMVISSEISDHRTGPQEFDIEGCLISENFDWFLPAEMSTPTPYYIITIKFSDNSEVSLYNWDSVDFSFYYRDRYSIFVNDELFRRVMEIYGVEDQ